MQYNKINSIWKRCFTEKDAETGEIRFLDKGKSGNPLIAGDYAEPAFGNIKYWRVDEKIDGMNIRVTCGWNNPFFLSVNPKANLEFHLEFGGRTDAAVFPPGMQETLQTLFTREKLEAVFSGSRPKKVIFYGEGYGPKIQQGGYYARTIGFVLFDIWIDGWWLERDNVKGIAASMGLEMVPEIGIMREEDIVEYVRGQPMSIFAKVEPHVMEGVVCRPEPLMLFRNGKQIIWKLKCKDIPSCAA